MEFSHLLFSGKDYSNKTRIGFLNNYENGKFTLISSDNKKHTIKEVGIYIGINNDTNEMLFAKDVVRNKKDDIIMSLKNMKQDDVEVLEMDELKDFEYAYIATYYNFFGDRYETKLWFSNAEDELIKKDGKVLRFSVQTNMSLYAFCKKEKELFNLNDERFSEVIEDLTFIENYKEFKYFSMTGNLSYIEEFTDFAIKIKNSSDSKIEIVAPRNISVPFYTDMYSYQEKTKEERTYVKRPKYSVEELGFDYPVFKEVMKEYNVNNGLLEKLNDTELNNYSSVVVRAVKNDLPHLTYSPYRLELLFKIGSYEYLKLNELYTEDEISKFPKQDVEKMKKHSGLYIMNIPMSLVKYMSIKSRKMTMDEYQAECKHFA